MCGIVGICGLISPEAITWLEWASERLRHRGPDEGANWIAPEGTAALGHRSLSIIDTSQGSDQPFVSADASCYW
jgi:asparagine synthase (glutamine-hydrolysing)